MFKKLVSNLSFSPGVASQLTFYAKRLRAEKFTRTLSLILGAGVFALQLATIVAPATNVNASGPSDILPGGAANQSDLVSVCRSNLFISTVYGHFGITCDNIQNASYNGSWPVRSSTWLSLGRERHAASDQLIQIGDNSFYLRPLSSVAISDTGRAVVGTSSWGHPFAILLSCGNPVVPSLPSAPPPPPPLPVPHPTPTPIPVPTPTPVPHPTPVPTPVPTPTPTPTPLPVPPPPPPTPSISQSKFATYITRAGSSNALVNADKTTANAGDVIEYTLKTSNTGDGAKTGYAVVEPLADVLEYANVTNSGGGTLQGNSLVWPAQTIPGRTTVTKVFQVTVKSPVPTTARSSSDIFSYDLCMDNVYGDAVHICVAAPPVKQIETTSESLPQTGPGLGVGVVAGFVALLLYFYARNRQLQTEVSILRVDHNPGVSS